jgi:hypothetical protein
MRHIEKSNGLGLYLFVSIITLLSSLLNWQRPVTATFADVFTLYPSHLTP